MNHFKVVVDKFFRSLPDFNGVKFIIFIFRYYDFYQGRLSTDQISF